MKFLHAADIHLDSPLAGLPDYPGAPTDEIRNATREAFSNMVDLAIERTVDFVVIAGDLYDGDWKSYNTGLYFHEQMVRLGKASIPVYIVLGNHDAASVITKKLDLPEHVHVFSSRKAKTEKLDDLGVALHGRSFPTRDVSDDLSAEYPDPVEGVFNIGVLHTAADGREGHLPYAPCSVASLEAKGYDYWALGHVHCREVLSDSPTILFPGNLQGRHIRETSEDGKGCTIVEVDQAGRVSLEHVPVDVVRWAHLALDVEDAEEIDAVYAAVKHALGDAYSNADGRVLAARITLTGATPVHAALCGDSEEVLNTIRATGLDIAANRIWIEKLVLDTRPAISPDTLRARADTLGDVARALDELTSDPEIRAGLQAELAVLFEKVTPDVFERAPELAQLRDGDTLDELLARAGDRVIASLAKE